MKKKFRLNNAAYVIGSTLLTLFCIQKNNIRRAEQISKEEFAGKYVFINQQKVPLQEFYENVFYADGYWIYKDRTGRNRKIDYISDFIHKKNKIAAKKWLERQKHRYSKVDTFYYQNTSEVGFKTDDGHVIFRNQKIEFKTLPTMGLSYPNGICIRQFEPAPGQKRLASIEQFNQEFNKTKEHEEAHNQHENPGKDLNHPTSMRQIGQSHVLSFSECYWTEMLANIEQLLAQHENYLSHGNSLNHITSRFKFYRDALRTGKIRSVPIQEFSKHEIKFIADSLYSYWISKKSPIYYNRSITRTLDLYRLAHANYNATREDTLRHLRVMRDKCVVRGIDFFPYLIVYDKDIPKQIRKEDLELFARDVENRKKQQTHLDELEGIRMEYGYEAYKARIYKNAQAAKILKNRQYIKNLLFNGSSR